MKPMKIKDGVVKLGAVHFERRLFDSLIPLPAGTSYNAYLVEGSEKVALIDTVDPMKLDVLMEQLNDVPKIDYVVSNHSEQDHSGSIPFVLEKYPEAKVICTPKAKTFLMDLLHIPEDKINTVEDNERISLGGKTLRFIHAPWVHWPETMFTYLEEDSIIFTCDFLGSHLATSELFAEDECLVYNSAKRYYAEIMMPFRNFIEKNLDKIKNLKIDYIAPSHGPVYNKPQFIFDAYNSWVYDDPKNIVVIPYITMHGSVKAMVDYLTAVLSQKGVVVKPFDLTVTDLGELAMSLVDAATIVVGTPTVLAGAHPQVIYATYLANALKPKTKFLSIIGSYSWGGKAVDQLSSMITNLKVEVIPPVFIKGLPKEADFKLLDELADTIVKKHKEMNIK
ncbi:FprA family A-type flavoprotein [Thermoanaerobacterium thermosaccharolyticum]|uniref:Metallo-beta-lactamase n=2 Tax=Thermoanaerobacterium thermosaccharolyticum TaxID=1517 RepID=A0A223I223_THETR|nr:FprA family A-type flavoprotein [Thermoanaerobacterium thermosaccharolyticum]TCW34250.1 flavorubredoxin [Thermohydrogenium kirishiense]AGB19285.1 putative flavoprotein [Thermoanaerobacterium thermosaccharolyticum M0795]AST58783.1 metallo-beta-lactamase [Thermoanaerobacterium thermosaccharolyticum]MBE0068350.1 FprA family A-type flavoprotein [Thermoanaerobacterium thermosaccharolyticum]MBE0228325.1 FprA family A-type flavoprotein [Thermoanaerobacterium thermosaccharolyticum]